MWMSVIDIIFCWKELSFSWKKIFYIIIFKIDSCIWIQLKLTLWGNRRNKRLLKMKIKISEYDVFRLCYMCDIRFGKYLFI